MTETADRETVSIENVSIHELALVTPRMKEEQFEALKADIELRGQLNPVKVYRNKIVDGRHRYIALKELNQTEIDIHKLPSNSTIKQLKEEIKSEEIRRHQSATTLAIYAWRQQQEDVKNGIKTTQAEAAKQYGISSKQVSSVSRLSKMRPDLIERLFNNEMVDIGDGDRPLLTDSIQSIINWINKQIAKESPNLIGIQARTELTGDEQEIVNQFVNAVAKESDMIIKEIAGRLYSLAKEGVDNY